MIARLALLVPFLLGTSAASSVTTVPSPRTAFHQHLVSPAFAQIIKQPPLDGAAFLKMLDAGGIGRGVILSMGYSFADERKGISDPDRRVSEENDWTSQQARASGGRLVGFCSVNPLRTAALAEIDRCLRLPAMVGLKLHFANSGVSLRNPDHVATMQHVFAAANARHAAIVVHMRSRTGSAYGAADARLFLEKLLPSAPDVVVQIAHLAGSGDFPPEAEEALDVFAGAIARNDSRTRHILFDQCTVALTSSSAEDGQRIARAIRRVGVKRVLFGSDMPVAGNPAPAESWAIFKAKVPLSASEFRTIALNDAAYMPRR